MGYDAHLVWECKLPLQMALGFASLYVRLLLLYRLRFVKRSQGFKLAAFFYARRFPASR